MDDSMSLMDESTLYPTRSSALPMIRKNHWEFYKKLFGDSDLTHIKEKKLTFKEFVVITVILHLNVNKMIHISDMGLRYGTGYVAVIYILFQLWIDMPLMMLCCFLSCYCRKSFLTFWDCVPLFQGIGYTMMVSQVFMNAHNIFAAAEIVLFSTDILSYETRNAALHCSYGAYSEFCKTPEDDLANLTGSDCQLILEKRNDTHFAFTAYQFYVRYYVAGYMRRDVRIIMNVRLIIAMLGLWILVFVVSILGLSRIKKVTVNLVIVLAILLFVVCSYTIIFIDTESGHRANYVNKTSAILNFQLWVDMVGNVGDDFALSTTIWLSSLIGHDYTPEVAVLTTTTLKIFICIAMFCFSARIMEGMYGLYGIRRTQCFFDTGNELIVGVIPEWFQRAEFGGIAAMLWHISILYFAVLSVIYCIIGLVNSLMERFTFFSKYRMILYFGFCVSGFLICTQFSFFFNLGMIYILRYCGFPLFRSIMLFLMILGLTFMYSTNRIIDDYSFSTGKPPAKYWIIFWKTSPLIALVACVFTLFSFRKETPELKDGNVIVGIYAMAALCTLPILVTLLVECCMHIKYKSLASLARPAEGWGPHNRLKRYARRYFYPQRDVKYRNTTLKCEHRCVINSPIYYDEVRAHNAKVNRAIEDYEQENNYEFSDLYRRTVRK